MKYKVVKDSPHGIGCTECAGAMCKSCDDFIKVNNLPSCADNMCHFEEDDTITDVDLREIDKSMDV
jgi:hypothetical protein